MVRYPSDGRGLIEQIEPNVDPGTVPGELLASEPTGIELLPLT